MELAPRQVVLLGLAALVPVIIFTIETGEYFAGIAAVNVIVIVGSLVIAMSETNGSGSQPSNGSTV